MRWSIEELVKYWKYYSEYSVTSWFKNFFHNRKRRIKLVFKWITTGYCQESLWGLDNFLSETILFRLKKFRQMRKEGFPATFKSQEEWNEKLDLLIEKFEFMVTEKFNKEWFEAWLRKDFEKEEILFVCQELNNKEALELFIEMYFHLWD